VTLRRQKEEDQITFASIAHWILRNPMTAYAWSRSLCTLPLSEKFPWVWLCQECGAVGEESTFTEVKACLCTKCGTTFAMKNMRFFEHRDELVRRCAAKWRDLVINGQPDVSYAADAY
jgi:hypothetical protein